MKNPIQEREAERVWYGLREVELSDDLRELIDDSIENFVKLIPQRLLKVNDAYYKEFPSQTNPQSLQNYLDRLRSAGLNVGKGDAEYGFKMPLPNKRDIYRKLVIFKRK